MIPARIYTPTERALDQLQVDITRLKRMTMGYRSKEDYEKALDFVVSTIHPSLEAVKDAIDNEISTQDRTTSR